ncbi:MAG: dihydrodipicolinate synthase family protein [Prevotellaceae bacterium]|jgi:4-hydroxy-tetrahydrodipicolinate synthase|nr:dihydrodipicolinate synthase family protein [Prevotellaceae bacterium]
MNKKYSGVVVPMITPIDEAGQIDMLSVTKIIKRFGACGVSPLLMGTTGEGYSLSGEQAIKLARTVINTPHENMVIYMGLNGSCLSEQLRLADHLTLLDADVMVVTLPPYYTLTAKQIYHYYRTLADRLSAPLMIYNIPSTTHQSIPLGVVKQLSEHPNIVGIKDSERDLERMEACIKLARDNAGFSYFCGWAAQCVNSLEMGADGIVPDTGNYAPEMFADLYYKVLTHNMTTARELQTRTDRIAHIYQANRSPGESLAALKVMMTYAGLCQPYMLSPLTRLTPQEEQDIIAKLKFH